MNGAWPPSSMLTRFTCAAACCAMSLPTSVEPVNVILRTIGLVTNSPPTVLRIARGDEVHHTLGNADLLEDLEHLDRRSGVCSAGLITMVQPAARRARSSG